MSLLSETKGLVRLAAVRDEFAREIRAGFEHRATPCSACETPGACCVDEHFVNVRVTRLEAKAIGKRLAELPSGLREKVRRRADEQIERHRLDETADETRTYACPLFEKGIGCLVHEVAKPLPCIAHACYEQEEDLPPDEMLAGRETEVAELNRKVYGRMDAPLPIPVAIASAENL